MSALPSKADMCGAPAHVCFGPIADIIGYSITSSARNGEAQRLRGLEVDHQFILGRRLHRKIARLFAFQDAIDIAGRSPILLRKSISCPGSLTKCQMSSTRGLVCRFDSSCEELMTRLSGMVIT
jgi:hypothetical protein